MVELDKNKKKSSLERFLISIVVLIIIAFGFFVLAIVYYNFIREYSYNKKSQEEIRKIEESYVVPPAPKEKLIEYYTNITFYSNDAVTEKNVSSKNELAKWNKQEVKVELSGDYNQNISDFFNQFIYDFNNISTSVKLIGVKSDGDIKINFQSHKSLAKLITDPRLLSRPQYGWTETSGGCQLKSAKIYLENDNMNLSDYLPGIKFVLGHELFHALGFPGHDTGGKYCNYMAPIPCGPINGFTQYDEFSIKTSYSSGIKACEKRPSVLKLLE